MKHIPRIYFEEEIIKGGLYKLPESSSHHIFNVLRLQKEDELFLFNKNSGEWRAKVVDVKKQLVGAKRICRKYVEAIAPSVIFCIIKPQPTSLLIEKVTELGAKHIFPVISQYTQKKDIKFEKFSSIIIKASEQCKRIDIPEIYESQNLLDFLDHYPLDGDLIIGDEELISPPLLSTMSQKSSFLIGPEGGFCEKEKLCFNKYDFIKKATICKNILRSETAAVAMMALWQAKFG